MITKVANLLPERDYVAFGYLLSQIRRSVCLSVVCNVRTPLSAGWNFRQCFTPFCTLAIRWSLCKILRRSSQGNPSVRLNARWVAKYSEFGPVEGYISGTVQDTASGTIND